MPSAPEGRYHAGAESAWGNPAAPIAGRMIAPIATTVAGDEPEIAANSAAGHHAGEAPGPPYQCPISDRRERDSCGARRRRG